MKYKKTKRSIFLEVRFFVVSIGLSLIFVSSIVPLYVTAQGLPRAFQDQMQPTVRQQQEQETAAVKAQQQAQAGVTKGSGTGDSTGGTTKGSGTGDSQKSGSGQKNACGDRICNPLKGTNTLDDFLTKLLKAINVIAAMVVTFFIILAGFKYVTAMGDEKKVTEAHNMLKWTVIGAAILFGAQVIAEIIKNTIGELTKVK